MKLKFMQRTVTALILLCLSISIVSCTEEDPFIPGENGGKPVGDVIEGVEVKIYAFGEDIGFDDRVIYNEEHGYYELPFLEIARGLGYIVVKKNDSTAEIFKNRNEGFFVLDANEKTLIHNKDGIEPENLFIIPPGASHQASLSWNGVEMYVDSDTLLRFLSEIGLTMIINRDMNEIDIIGY